MAPPYPQHRAGPLKHPDSYKNNPKRRAYLGQKYGAKNRGIEFCFTYEEWEAWWIANLGPDWFLKRGNKRGLYCMGRKHDKGPYVPHNVECILHERNSFDASVRGLTCCKIRQDRT